MTTVSAGGHANADRGAHKVFCQTPAREPMAALPDELSGESGPRPIARPDRDVRFAGR